jgi:exosome complex RNA-binding protein Csl4
LVKIVTAKKLEIGNCVERLVKKEEKMQALASGRDPSRKISKKSRKNAGETQP